MSYAFVMTYIMPLLNNRDSALGRVNAQEHVVDASFTR